MPVDVLAIGFATLFEPTTLLMLMVGVVAGLVIGSIPGLNDNIAFAVFIPFSFSMGAEHALALMVGVYCATAIGGAIPAIMVRVPGTASAMLTGIDGNAMARRGEAGTALSLSITSSVVGGIASAVVLLFFAPLLAQFALRFGYVENFALGVLGMASVVGMLSGNVVKGLVSAALGLLVATIGFSLETGFPRFTFGEANLIEGVPFVPLLVGLFGMTAVFELLDEIARERRAGGGTEGLPVIGSLKLPRALVRRMVPTWVKSAAIGNVIGVIPGAGALMAIYLSYDQAARRYRARYEGRDGAPDWGKGAPEGVAAPEAANNAVVASSMVPLLSLGIPGNSVSALFIAALAIQGMVPGPLLFIQHKDIAWMVIVGFLVANIVMGPVAYLMVKTLTRLVFSISKEAMAGAIALLCLTGAYADGNSVFNIWVALVAGTAGYAMHKVNIPLAPAILAIILGQRIEDSLINSLTISNGDWFVFIDPVGHPISLGLLAVAALFMVGPTLSRLRTRRPRTA